MKPYEAVIHLAAIVGFSACQAVGKQVSWRYNVESVHRVFAFAVNRVFAFAVRGDNGWGRTRGLTARSCSETARL